MSNGSVIYSGIVVAKGAKYTATRGVTPDKISVRMIPQVTPIAAEGNLTLGYGAETFTLDNCLADRSNIMLTKDGFVGTIVFQDRRWRWSRQPAVSYHWNERGPDGEIVGVQTSLRFMIERVLRDLGETNFSAGPVSTSVFPEVDVSAMRPDLLLQYLTDSYGYSVSIGASGDPVRIHQNGVGLPLPINHVMAFSRSVDPPTPPATARVEFGASLAQARFKMINVGLDTDGVIKPVDDLSYTPAGGWENTGWGMGDVREEFGEDEQNLAIEWVHRVYAVDKFADDTLDLPDGSGSLSSINQVLPLFGELIETSVVEGRTTKASPRVFGRHTPIVFPFIKETTLDQKVLTDWTFDRYRGLVRFATSVYMVDEVSLTKGQPDLYLEAAFSIRDINTNQHVHYKKDIAVGGGGYGYLTVPSPNIHARTIVQYDRLHGVTGTVTNQTTLDTLATGIAAAALGQYTFKAGEMRWYNRPMWGVRLDGQITQIMHTISDGTDGEPGHYTVVSANMEFDHFIRTEEERRRDLHLAMEQRNSLNSLVLSTRKAKGNG